MIIAKAKKKENIAEYILYMWQVENLIRLLDFDIEKINKDIIQRFDQPDEVKQEMKNWYLGLIAQLKEENKVERGHLQFILNTINDLNDLHLQMISSSTENEYKAIYSLAKPGIDDLVSRSGKETINEIEACFNALYGLLLFRMQNKNITPETAQAMQHISRLIAELSKKHKQIEKGEIEI
jgi:hypothetical protein